MEIEISGHAVRAHMLLKRDKASAMPLSSPGRCTTRREILNSIRRETVNFNSSLQGGREGRELNMSTVLELSLYTSKRAGTEGNQVAASTAEVTAKASKKKMVSVGGLHGTGH